MFVHPCIERVRRKPKKEKIREKHEIATGETESKIDGKA